MNKVFRHWKRLRWENLVSGSVSVSLGILCSRSSFDCHCANSWWVVFMVLRRPSHIRVYIALRCNTSQGGQSARTSSMVAQTPCVSSGTAGSLRSRGPRTHSVKDDWKRRISVNFMHKLCKQRFSLSEKMVYFNTHKTVMTVFRRSTLLAKPTVLCHGEEQFSSLLSKWKNAFSK